MADKAATADGYSAAYTDACERALVTLLRGFVMVEFLRDADENLKGGAVATVENEEISALAIKHAGIVRDWFSEIDVTAELLDGGGVTTEKVHYADVAAFITLKSLAFGDRAENKDAADLIHVMRYAGSLDWVAEQFVQRRRAGLHINAIDSALAELERRFCDGKDVADGHLRDGPVACARFIYGLEANREEQRLLEQRQVSGLVTEFLRLVKKGLAQG